ncbi:MAG: nitroreductase family protein [Anaerolineae bacterium]
MDLTLEELTERKAARAGGPGPSGGHPLFTIELLRNLQECGDPSTGSGQILLQDEAGRWVEGAAIVFIVGDKRIPLSVESAQYALSNMIFYAQAKGIGSCPWGPGQLFYDRSKPVRKRLGLQKREHILGTLLLGYPAVRFANKVEGKTLRIQWNGG